MRLIGIGLAVALAIGVSAPSIAFAKPKETPPAAGAIDPAMQKKGMADAPALLTKSGAACTLTDARMIGGEKGKVIKAYYEVACQDAEGLVLISDSSTPDTVLARPCLEFEGPGPDGKPNQLQCKLPANANQTPFVQTLTAASGNPCTVSKYRYIGASPTNAFLEVVCSDNTGFVLVTSAPPSASKEVKANTCLAFDQGAGNIYCSLIDKETQLAVADKLIIDANNGCQPNGHRYLFATVDGSTYFEIACANKKGYVVQRTKDGKMARAVDCTEVTGSLLQGGCQLVDTVAAKTEKAAFYSNLATRAGFKCNVAQYGMLPSTGATEVVELQCNDRPDGAILISDKDGSKAYNCGLALAIGYRCTFTKIETAYPGLTTLLKNFPGKSYNCNVDKIGAWFGSDQSRYLEVSCGVGEGTLVMQMKPGSPDLVGVTFCPMTDAKGKNLCTLPQGGV